jgi:signal transduction histidine kinase
MIAEERLKAAEILVVDDLEPNVRLLERLLRKVGYGAVRTTTDPLQVVELVRAREPDLILLDLLMPKLDGYGVMAAVRALLPEDDYLPVLVITADATAAAKQRALSSGAHDFLTKPFDHAEVLLRTRNLLATRFLQRDLRGQRDELARTQRQKDELAAFIVHDLKNPLTAICANAQILAGSASEDAAAAAADIVSAGRTMLRLVMNILDVSRSEGGALQPHWAELDLAELVRDAARVAGAAALPRRQRLVVEAGGSPLPLEADRELLERVLENLLDNAIKYAPSGGELRLELVRREGAAVVRLADGGPGVPLAYREKIFDKYARLDSGDGAQLRHSRGLGLAFCRLAVEAHGGRIWVEDNSPVGSVFCFELPL